MGLRIGSKFTRYHHTEPADWSEAQSHGTGPRTQVFGAQADTIGSNRAFSSSTHAGLRAIEWLYAYFVAVPKIRRMRRAAISQVTPPMQFVRPLSSDVQTSYFTRPRVEPMVGQERGTGFRSGCKFEEWSPTSQSINGNRGSHPHCHPKQYQP